MMTIDDIIHLIKADESRTLELKKSTGELKEAMHSACAFLNTDGGWLIFGIAPSSLKIVGQDVSDQTQRELSQALSHLEPAVDVRVEYIDVPNSSNQKIVAIHFIIPLESGHSHKQLRIILYVGRKQSDCCL